MKGFLGLFGVVLFVSVLNYFVFDREINDVLIGLLTVTIGLGIGYFIKYLFKRTKENKLE